MREGLDAEPTVGNYFEAIDRYHLVERLADALEIVEPDAAQRKCLLDKWQGEFDYADTTIDSIERLLKTRLGWVKGEAAEKLAEHLVYIHNNKDRMRYATIRNEGLPVGSGTTEGSCKSVVGERCKGSGQRWSEPGLRAALGLRAWYCSDRFPLVWRHLSSRYTAEVTNEEASIKRSPRTGGHDGGAGSQATQPSLEPHHGTVPIDCDAMER
jgi:hypothetical protein